MAGRFSVEAIIKAVDKVTAPVRKMQNSILKFTRTSIRSVKKLDRQLGALAGTMKKTALAGAAAITGAAFLVGRALNGVADDADALAKQSRRLDFDIEGLQEWRFVAEQSGVSSELLNKSLGAFSKRLGEAAVGVGPLAAGLKKLNPDLLKQLNAADGVSDAFDIYIKAMREADTATEKAALANAAFSRSGLQMVDITKNSASAVEALRKEQRQNGIITMQQAESAEAYNDAVNSLKKTFAGFVQQVLLPLAPILTDLSRKTRAWLLENKSEIIEKIGKSVAWLIENFKTFIKWGKRVAIITAVVVSLTLVLKSFILVMTAVNLVMSLNPIGLIVIGIAAAIAAITLLILNFDKVKAWFLDLPGPVKVAFAVLGGPIAALIAAASLIMENWQPIKGFFISLWDSIGAAFDARVKKMMAIIERIKSAWESVTGLFSDDEDAQKSQRNQSGQVMGSNMRAAEAGTFNRSEVLIRDKTNRAEVVSGSFGAGLSLQSSGAF